MFRCGTIGLWIVFSFPVSLTGLSAAVASPRQAQHASSTAARARADYSQEPYVIEKYRTTIRFENDGTNERVLSVRVRIQSDAAAEKFGTLSFPYNAANEQVNVRSVVVRKKDGAKIPVPDGAAKDLPAKASPDAPAYPDCMIKQVSLPKLISDDILEYEVETRIVKALAPNQFWFEHNFVNDAIVLDEQLELNLPQGRAYSLKAPGYSTIAGKPQPLTAPAKEFSFSQTSENGRTLLLWNHANRVHKNEDDQQRARERAQKPPDIQLTTFLNWDEVARWESKAAREADDPSSDVTSKSLELAKPNAADDAKMRAIYAYVSKNIRLVPGSFGSDRFQPRSPAETLKNGYGDCDDIQALLSAMLMAAGIRAETAFVPSSRSLDAALPSPAQFDRVLTVIQRNPDAIWLDPSAEFAPFGFLPRSARGKSALLVSSDGSNKIVKTPADPPFPSTQRVDIETSANEIGKLSGTIHYLLRGDTEFVLRNAFRRAPSSEWNQLAQTILTLDGLHADAASVKTSDPSDTEKPFELSIDFAQQNFLDWSSKSTRVALPLLTIGLPDPPVDAKRKIDLGSPLDVITRLTLKLPPHFLAQVPVGTAVSRDYAEFKATYRFENDTLTAERSLNFKLREIPADRTPDYVAFTHAVQADEAQSTIIENTTQAPATIPASASADDLFDAGTTALKSGNLLVAIPFLQRVTVLDPKHTHVWNDLGLAYFRVGKFDDATAVFRKQLDVNPSDEHANEYLGLALEQQRHDDDAAAAFRRQIELNPLDTIAHAALGTILLEQHDDSAAVTELEKATILSPENAELEVSLGRAYLNVRQNQKALDAFHKSIDLSPKPPVWNNVAYNLAEHNVDLNEALKYAQSAVKAGAENLANLTLARVTPGDFAHVSNLAAYWDTLGWVYFHQGDFRKAERYIRGAWLVGGRGTSGDHLAQIYEKLGYQEQAIQTYALALFAPDPNPDTRPRLMLLLGGNTQVDDLLAKTKPEADKVRTFTLKGTVSADASADFLVLFSDRSDEKGSISTQVDGVTFLSGSESLKPFTYRLRLLNYEPMFPAASPTKIVLRGILNCPASAGECSFTLIPGAMATPAN